MVPGTGSASWGLRQEEGEVPAGKLLPLRKAVCLTAGVLGGDGDGHPGTQSEESTGKPNVGGEIRRYMHTFSSFRACQAKKTILE